jgi:hypothetical protein
MFATALKGYVKLQREEARNEGQAEGEAKGKAETLIRLLDRRFGISVAEREQVLACGDTERLDLALDAILDAPDAGTVLGILQ